MGENADLNLAHNATILVAVILAASLVVALCFLRSAQKKADEAVRELNRLRALSWLTPAMWIVYTHVTIREHTMPDFMQWQSQLINRAEAVHGRDVWVEYGKRGQLPLISRDRYPEYFCDTATIKAIETAVRSGMLPIYTHH
jgi:hypothetical protein